MRVIKSTLIDRDLIGYSKGIMIPVYKVYKSTSHKLEFN